MASLEQMIGTYENAYRVPEKMQQSKGGRKPLRDVTNSSKPRGKDKSSAKPFNGFKVKQKVLISSPKTGRKPLRDLSNSNKPQANQKSSKKYSTENLSVVSEEEQVENWDFHEGFLHDHSKCIEAQKQSGAMSMDYFLEEILGLEKDSSSSVFTPEETEVTEWELDQFELEMDFPPTPPSERMSSPPTPKSPDSPLWKMDSKYLEQDWFLLESPLLELKLKDC